MAGGAIGGRGGLVGEPGLCIMCKSISKRAARGGGGGQKERGRVCVCVCMVMHQCSLPDIVRRPVV